MTHKINLDFVDHEAAGDGTDPVAPDGILPAQTVEEFERYNLTYQVVERYGPGGGNPNLDVFGTEEDLTRYAKEVYCANTREDDLNFVLEGIKPV